LVSNQKDVNNLWTLRRIIWFKNNNQSRKNYHLVKSHSRKTLREWTLKNQSYIKTMYRKRKTITKNNKTRKRILMFGVTQIHQKRGLINQRER